MSTNHVLVEIGERTVELDSRLELCIYDERRDSFESEIQLDKEQALKLGLGVLYVLWTVDQDLVEKWIDSGKLLEFINNRKAKKHGKT